MKRELLIFGSNGALGRGVTRTMIEKEYDRIYLFDFTPGKFSYEDSKIHQIAIEDLSLEENVKKAFTDVQPDKEKLFFLFTTIGGFAGGRNIWQTDSGESDEMMSLNFKTNFLLAKYFSNIVSASGGGSICFTAAYVGLQAEKMKSAYGASKAALIHLIKSLALEGKEINLSANGIAPYIIDTPANRDWMKNADYSGWMKPEEIGQLVENLFENFHFISGNIISLKDRFEIR